MKQFASLAVVLFAAAAFAGCTTPAQDHAHDVCSAPGVDTENPIVAMDTTMGCMYAEVYLDKVPVTAQNFLDLVASEFYDGTKFHRIITDFMMQGGDPNSKDDDPSDDGRGGPGYAIQDEFHPSLRHNKPYLLSMANSGPNTGGSQFFVTFVPTPWLDNKHAIFGAIIVGTDVVDKVNAEASSQSGVPPAKQVTLRHATVLEYEAPEPVPSASAMMSADFITPGAFGVSSTTDEILIWARNTGDEPGSATWSLTGPEGAALPSGWMVTFDHDMVAVDGHGAKPTMLKLEMPSLTAGTYPVELHTGSSTTNAVVTVASAMAQPSKEGDKVAVQYRGYCLENGDEFDAGSFPTTLGSGQTIPGFDYGLIGVSEGEQVTIEIPGPLAYGNRGPCGSFDNKDLAFEVSLNFA